MGLLLIHVKGVLAEVSLIFFFSFRGGRGRRGIGYWEHGGGIPMAFVSVDVSNVPGWKREVVLTVVVWA